MPRKKCFIIGAGDFAEKTLPVTPGDLIIAADGGWVHLDKIGMRPHLIVGDFDSSPRPDYPGDIPEIIEVPREKDDSDTLLAVKEALVRGFVDIIIYGGTGGRLDHTMANIAALRHIAISGGRGRLMSENQIAECITGEAALKFPPEKAGYISIFAWGGKAAGVTLSGLKYPLTNATLTPEFPLGLSNEFTGTPSEIKLKTGSLVIIYER